MKAARWNVGMIAKVKLAECSRGSELALVAKNRFGLCHGVLFPLLSPIDPDMSRGDFELT